MSDNSTIRILGYTQARELTPEEIARVSGGASSNTPSYSGPGNAQRRDDVVTDDV